MKYAVQLFIYAGLLIAPHFALAQTRDEFSQKYGPKNANGQYTIRPDIGFEAKYKNRILSDIIIEPLKDNDDGSRNIMSSERAEEVFNELVPEGKRGRKMNEEGAVAEFSCISVNYTEYERVKVSVIKRCAEQGEGTFSIKVQWK